MDHPRTHRAGGGCSGIDRRRTHHRGGSAITRTANDNGFYPVIERDSDGIPVRVWFTEGDSVRGFSYRVLGRYTEPFATCSQHYPYPCYGSTSAVTHVRATPGSAPDPDPSAAS